VIERHYKTSELAALLSCHETTITRAAIAGSA
jgi:hypothetical protein